MKFSNRTEAGRQLGALLAEYKERSPIVVGMPRGGVPVAFEVAKALGAPLDIAVVRKLGAPSQPEFAIGALAEGGLTLVNRSAQHSVGASAGQLEEVIAMERAKLERRAKMYRAECPQLDLNGRVAILVDDGLATGSTAIAAARSLRERGAAEVTLAVPVCTAESLDRSPDPAIDRVACLLAPQPFMGVGMWYGDFAQVSDDEVLALLRQAGDRNSVSAQDGVASESELAFDVGSGVHLPGTLTMPSEPRGLVIFAHGSGSSRTSPRNQMVAEILNRSGFATLLFDLLDSLESTDRSNVFDIPLLGNRLVVVTRQVLTRPELEHLPVGLFGASTGAAAALWAAAELGPKAGAVVSRGGRPDLAAARLTSVTAPTLLIVGGDDSAVIELNREAMRRMTCPNELRIVEHAGHLFEGRGQLERVAEEAASWFALHLRRSADHAVA